MGKKKLLFAALISAVCLILALWFLRGNKTISAQVASVNGEVNLVSSKISGYVNSVDVNNNQYVQAGQTLIRLDPNQYLVALAEAKAVLADLEAKLQASNPNPSSQNDSIKNINLFNNTSIEELIRNEELAKQEVVRYSTAHAQAMIDLNRVRALVAKGSISQAQLGLAKTQEENSKANLSLAKLKLEAASRARALKEADIQRPSLGTPSLATNSNINTKAYEAQLARVKQAEANLDNCLIKAPVDGHISKKKVEAGQLIERGQTLMNVVPLNPKDLWVNATFSEDELAQFSIAQYVEVQDPADPSRIFKGYIESLTQCKTANFGNETTDNTASNSEDLQAGSKPHVHVRLINYNSNLEQSLKIGMKVTATAFLDKVLSEVEQRDYSQSNNLSSTPNSPQTQQNQSQASHNAPATNSAPQNLGSQQNIGQNQQMQNQQGQPQGQNPQTQQQPQTNYKEVQPLGLPAMQPTQPSQVPTEQQNGQQNGQIFNEQQYTPLHEPSPEQKIQLQNQQMQNQSQNQQIQQTGQTGQNLEQDPIANLAPATVNPVTLSPNDITKAPATRVANPVQEPQ